MHIKFVLFSQLSLLSSMQESMILWIENNRNLFWQDCIINFISLGNTMEDDSDELSDIEMLEDINQDHTVDNLNLTFNSEDHSIFNEKNLKVSFECAIFINWNRTHFKLQISAMRRLMSLSVLRTSFLISTFTLVFERTWAKIAIFIVMEMMSKEISMQRLSSYALVQFDTLKSLHYS